MEIPSPKKRICYNLHSKQVPLLKGATIRSIEDCSKNFIETLRKPSRKNPIDITITYRRKWLRGAIIAASGAGNPPGSTLKPNETLTDKIGELLIKWQHTLELPDNGDNGCTTFDRSIIDYMCRMQDACEDISPDCWWPFGRIQKVFNIWLKYHIALHYSAMNLEYTRSTPWIPKVLMCAHVPIDRVVLDFLAPRHKQFTDIGYGRLSWKSDLQRPRYETLQKILRKEAEINGYSSALHYEMDKIWTEENQGIKAGDEAVSIPNYYSDPTAKKKLDERRSQTVITILNKSHRMIWMTRNKKFNRPTNEKIEEAYRHCPHIKKRKNPGFNSLLDGKREIKKSEVMTKDEAERYIKNQYEIMKKEGYINPEYWEQNNS